MNSYSFFVFYLIWFISGKLLSQICIEDINTCISNAKVIVAYIQTHIRRHLSNCVPGVIKANPVVVIIFYKTN